MGLECWTARERRVNEVLSPLFFFLLIRYKLDMNQKNVANHSLRLSRDLTIVNVSYEVYFPPTFGLRI
jgi:hypothetical protein